MVRARTWPEGERMVRGLTLAPEFGIISVLDDSAF
jgi:hypothetical protein